MLGGWGGAGLGGGQQPAGEGEDLSRFSFQLTQAELLRHLVRFEEALAALPSGPVEEFGGQEMIDAIRDAAQRGETRVVPFRRPPGMTIYSI